MTASSYTLSMLDLVPRLGESTYEEALRQAGRLARHGEAWGYKRYWAAEHHDLEHLSCASPEVLLAHIGAQTTRIRLGSGAVLLPHYSPLKVAENFRMLAALYPGRIDLGIGRAPGGSAHTSMALSGNYLGHVADLPNRIRALTELLEDRYRYEDVPIAARPVPAKPPVMWMLGTNTKSSGFAAEFGAGFVFGHFMSEVDGADVLKSYREHFRPSAAMREPHSMVAVSIICGDTERRAQELAMQAQATRGTTGPESSDQHESNNQHEPNEQRKRNVHCERNEQCDSKERHGMPSSQSALSVPQGQGMLKHVITGTPSAVREQLLEMKERYGNDEFLVTVPVADYEERLNCYRLLAGESAPIL